VVTRETGPNDARRVVWAIGMCFFFHHIFYILNNNFYLFRFNIPPKTGSRDETGPNDASDASFGPYVRVFFPYIRVFYYLLMYYRFY
jgi:hypothetical protein